MAELQSFTLAGFPGLFAAGEQERRESPILFLHGAFADHRAFGNYMHFFSAAGFDCYAASHRGRLGFPPKNAEGVCFRDYLDDTMRMIGALPRPSIVMGHSMGGLTAQKVAEAGRCRAMVLLASAPAGMLTAQVRSLPAFIPVLPSILRGKPFRPSPAAIARVALNRVPEAERQRILAGFVPESGRVYWEMMTGAIRVNSADVKCPVLCVGGMEDRIISRRLIQQTARKYQACLREYPQHAHWLLEEPKWESIAGDILVWLKAKTRPV